MLQVSDNRIGSPMVKRKKKPARAVSRGFGVKDLAAELNRAEKFLVKKDWDSAILILLPLSEQYPDDPKVWEYLSYAANAGDRFPLYLQACEGLIRLKPENPDVAYALAGAYLANALPLMALQTFRNAIELDPEHDNVSDAQETIQALERVAKKLLAEVEVEGEDGWEIAVLQEKALSALEFGDFAAARQAANAALDKKPDFLPTRNTLSLISWHEGQLEDAIASAQAILEDAPNNISALANLVRFLTLTGDEAAARPHAETLKITPPDHWDGWMQKAEGLSYLRDDAAVLEVFEQAKAADVLDEDQISPKFFHLVGVAFARLGHRDEAIEQWQKALELYEGYPLAEENLIDIRHTVDLRHGAWPFAMSQWFLPGVAEDLIQTINAAFKFSKLSKKLDQNVEQFLNSHPDFTRKAPIVLERGGPQGQSLILSMAGQLRTPELLATLKDFALSQNGNDDMRREAATLAAEAKLLPRTVSLWKQGEWRETRLMAYQFYEEVVSRSVEEARLFLDDALFLFEDADAKAVEKSLQESLAIEPDHLETLCELVRALNDQGQEAEAKARLEDLLTRYPDDLYVQMAQARKLIADGDLDAAEAIILPVLERESFFYRTFAAVSDVYIALLNAQKQRVAAREWLDMWESLDPDNPRLVCWIDEFDKLIQITKP
jgi:tetratricopeptide (TPR) repeat protein